MLLEAVGTGLLSQGFLLVSGVLVARLLGAEWRGHLAGLAAWPILLTSAGNLGVPLAMVFFISRDSARAHRVVHASLPLLAAEALVLSSIGAVVLGLWSRTRPGEVRWACLPALLLITPMLLHQFALAALQGLQRFRVFNLCRLLPSASYALGVAILSVAGERRIVAVAWIWFLAYTAAATLSASVVWRLGEIRGGDERLRKDLLSFGIRGYLGSASPLETFGLDQLVLALIAPARDLGLYAAASAFGNLPRLVARSAAMIVYPTIAAGRRDESARRNLWRAVASISAGNVAVVAVLIPFVSFLTLQLFGHGFADAAPIAVVLLVGATMASSRTLLVEGMRGLGYPEISSKAEWAMYPWLVPVGLLWTLRSGVIGLAEAIAIGFAISLATAVAFSVRAARRLPPVVLSNEPGTLAPLADGRKGGAEA